MAKIENKSKYIGFSFFKNVLDVKNINFEINTFFADKKKKSDEFNIYFTYSEIEILNSSLHNLIFILKNFEKEFFSLNLFVLKNILEKINLEEFKKNIENKPNSEFLRKIGFLIEKVLKINIYFGNDFLVKKTYINILNENIFITNINSPVIPFNKGDEHILYNFKDKKYKIIDNSLGEFGEFNPVIIKQDLNPKIFETNFNENLDSINNKFDYEIIEKAINYLYTKETKGSLEIEGEHFHQSKNRGFLKLISNIPIKKEISKKDILNFYNTIYNDNKENYREKQNYIGSGNGMMGENIIEYIPPISKDLEKLMNNLIIFYNKNYNNLNPVILSSILSAYFVLIHPFLDGNGRTSRFLFQFSLLNSGIGIIGNKKIILPVSAYIQLNKTEYYKNLENISGKLIDFIKFEEEGNGEIKVLNETKIIYSNLDFTQIINYFYKILNNSINIDYKKELEYINNFYTIYNFIDNNYNIASNNISFITKNLIGNNGTLSISKKKVLEKKGVSLENLEDIEEKFRLIKKDSNLFLLINTNYY